MEIISERQRQSKTFDLGGNKRQIVTKLKPVHYKDENDNFQDISMDIENGRVHKCEYDISLYADKIGYHGTDPKGKVIELELELPYKEPTIEGNVATYSEVEPDVDFILAFLPNRVEAKRILKTPTANRVANYRSYREEGITGKLVNLGQDKKKKIAKISVVENNNQRANETEIIQTFDGQVGEMDSKTRIRTWSDDVTYPVVIDPTSTFDVGTVANDGVIVGSGDIPPQPPASWNRSTYDYNNSNYVLAFNVAGNAGTYPYDRKAAAYAKFPITGISKGATITSATLKLWGGGKYTSYPVMNVGGMDSATPTPVSNGNAILGTGSGRNRNTLGGQIDTTWSHYVSTYNYKSSYALKTINVQAIVSALTAKYDYTSATMMFIMNHDNGTSPSSGVLVYQSDWGTSKDPQLVINYTNPTPPSGSGYKVGGVTDPAKVGGVIPFSVGGILA